MAPSSPDRGRRSLRAGSVRSDACGTCGLPANPAAAKALRGPPELQRPRPSGHTRLRRGPPRGDAPRPDGAVDRRSQCPGGHRRQHPSQLRTRRAAPRLCARGRAARRAGPPSPRTFLRSGAPQWRVYRHRFPPGRRPGDGVDLVPEARRLPAGPPEARHEVWPSANRYCHAPSPQEVVKVIKRNGRLGPPCHPPAARHGRAHGRGRGAPLAGRGLRERGGPSPGRVRRAVVPPPAAGRGGTSPLAARGEPDAGLFGTKGITGDGGLRSKDPRRAGAVGGLRPFSPHGLRRAAVDAPIRAGIDVGAAASLLGHSARLMLQHHRTAIR